MLLGVLFGFLSFGTSVHGSVKQSGTTSTRLFENVTSGLSLKNSTSSDVDDLGSRIRRNESVSLNVAQIHLQLREEVSAINLTAANYSFNEDAVRQIQQSVTNYATLISDVAGTHNLSYDTRRAAIESYLGLIVTVADVMGSRRVTTGAVSDSLTNAILHGARALVILQTHASDNHSIAIGVPPSRYIGGGFIEAVHLGASSIQGAPGSQGAQQDAVVYSNTHAAFVLDPRAAFFRRRANVPKFEAVAIVEFSDDSLFPSAENQSRPAWVGSSILSVSLGSPVRDLIDMNRLCGTYVYSIKSNSVPTRSTTSHPGTNLKPKCVYYNHSLLSWRGDGCSLTFANSTHATCCCNHLTSFAVLIEEEEMTTKDSLAIETITWVSVGGSVFFLLLSAFTILGTPELHKQLHYKILLNLIFALASSQITFFFISVPTSTIPCKLVALLLLYTILSALAWMNVEGHELFHTFVRTDVWHHSQSDAALLRRYATVAWGLPLIITLVALMDSDGLISTSETRSSNDTRVDVSISHCWFNPESSIRWVFLAPMLIAVSTGIVFTTIVLWTVMKLLRAQKLGKESSVEAVTGRAKVAFMIMSLTGSGWVFGVLMLLKIGLAWTPYAFTIASGGQGVLVFFFHVRDQTGEHCICGLTIAISRSTPKKLVAIFYFLWELLFSQGIFHTDLITRQVPSVPRCETSLCVSISCVGIGRGNRACTRNLTEFTGGNVLWLQSNESRGNGSCTLIPSCKPHQLNPVPLRFHKNVTLWQCTSNLSHQIGALLLLWT